MELAAPRLEFATLAEKVADQTVYRPLIQLVPILEVQIATELIGQSRIQLVRPFLQIKHMTLEGIGGGLSDLMSDDDSDTDEPSNGAWRHRGIDLGSPATDKTRMGADRARLAELDAASSLDLRLRLAKELAGGIEVSLKARLVDHLIRLRAEAESAGREDLAKQADQLLKSLERPED